MQLENIDQELLKIIDQTTDGEVKNWLKEKITKTLKERSTKELYLTYSLIGSKIDKKVDLQYADANILKTYLEIQQGNLQQVVRIYFLRQVLKADVDFFAPKVANIIQVADTGELETFLKFLILLPNPESYKFSAVEALRTNIATVFNAITYNNPYPSNYFNDQQWNQMYLKTAFMQGNLSAIQDIDRRANADLARIISDYAHERWAAGRTIDPYFWRPVIKFLDETLLADMKRLLESKDSNENHAAALCLFNSDRKEAKVLLEKYPELEKNIENNTISWSSLKN